MSSEGREGQIAIKWLSVSWYHGSVTRNTGSLMHSMAGHKLVQTTSHVEVGIIFPALLKSTMTSVLAVKKKKKSTPEHKLTRTIWAASGGFQIYICWISSLFWVSSLSDVNPTMLVPSVNFTVLVVRQTGVRGIRVCVESGWRGSRLKKMTVQLFKSVLTWVSPGGTGSCVVSPRWCLPLICLLCKQTWGCPAEQERCSRCSLA